jgi:hypothetical protein
VGMAGYGVFQTVEIRSDLFSTKSFSRVATFAKATAAEEHVERVDLWKEVERFMAGWSATEMPR